MATGRELGGGRMELWGAEGGGDRRPSTGRRSQPARRRSGFGSAPRTVRSPAAAGLSVTQDANSRLFGVVTPGYFVYAGVT